MSAAQPHSVCLTCRRVYPAGEQYCPLDLSPLSPAQPVDVDPLRSTVIAGSYTLLERIGAGGMGVVYRAWQNRLERNVAVKLFFPRPDADPAAADRFRTEALAVSQLSNPHTVAIHDFGSTPDGKLYLVMHLLEGESLRARLARGPLPLRSAISIAAQICESLGEAHERKPAIIHRDIKPDNVIVRQTPDGEEFATVLDFGLARLMDSAHVTISGFIVGTPAYMAPESAKGESNVDARADLYSVGAMLHEMISGQAPFKAENSQALLYKHVWEPPPSLTTVCPDQHIPDSLERLVLDLLAKEPDKRPTTAAITRTRLQKVMRHVVANISNVGPRPIAELTPTPGVAFGLKLPPMRTPAQKRRPVIAVAAVAAVAISVLVIAMFARPEKQSKAAVPKPMVTQVAVPNPLPKVEEPPPAPPPKPAVAEQAEPPPTPVVQVAAQPPPADTRHISRGPHIRRGERHMPERAAQQTPATKPAPAGPPGNSADGFPLVE